MCKRLIFWTWNKQLYEAGLITKEQYTALKWKMKELADKGELS